MAGHGPVAHEFRVIFGIGGAGDAPGQLGQVDGPAGGLKICAGLELLGHGDKVDGNAALEQFAVGGVNQAMGGQIEVILVQDVYQGVEGFGL